MTFGCIGCPLGHSYSPDIHRALGDYSYEMREISADALDSFMRAKAFDGINVTVPYKEAVLPYLDHLSDEARAIGAVNTIINRNGKLTGYNTDFYGLSALLRKNGVDMSGKKVLICGTGGTSKTARAVADALGAEKIYRLSRHPSGDAISYGAAYEIHADADIIINTTPLGMFPNFDGCAVDLTRFAKLSAAVDVVYNPCRTLFLQQAQAMGVTAVGGLYMLVAQAAKAAELFTGQKIPEPKIGQIYHDLLIKKQNIVLIGMPTSGKTTVGKALAGALSLAFVDTDELFAETTGQTPNEFLRTHSETEFRDRESDIITALRLHGTVIATGGGAVLREKNVSALKRDGKVYFLDRPFDKLSAADDRPLSSDRQALRRLFDERYEIYRSAADRHIDAAEDVETVKNTIIKDRER